jgi:P pilus assembly chaperone PapD
MRNRLVAACWTLFGHLAATSIIGSSAVFALAAPAYAAGDLLVAPTRVVLDGRRGTEVILSNIGDEEATYRISLELRRMNAAGRLDDVIVEDANETEKAALATIRFAPRRVTLPPNQPQSIRIGLQPMDALPDGEYRAHMLFRAIPKTQAATDVQDAGNGLKIQLIPVYGVTIPIIVRKGNLEATAAMANVKIGASKEGPALTFDLSRKGVRSVFGEVHVTKPGVAEPLIVAKGIAIYPEVEARQVSLPFSPEIAAKMHGEVVVSYYEAPEAGGGLITQARSVLP